MTLLNIQQDLDLFPAGKSNRSVDETILQVLIQIPTVVLNAKLHKPVAEFEGEFGMGNLGFLNGICSLPNYKEDDASVEVTRRDFNGTELKV